LTKDEFLDMTRDLFTSYGFRRKSKNYYYFRGLDQILGLLWLEGSMHGGGYYFHAYFYQNDLYPKSRDIPTGNGNAIPICNWNFVLLSKRKTDGKRYKTHMIQWEDFTEEELRPIMEAFLQDYVMLPLLKGKEGIKEFLEKTWLVNDGRWDEKSAEYFSRRAKEIIAKIDAGEWEAFLQESFDR